MIGKRIFVPRGPASGIGEYLYTVPAGLDGWSLIGAYGGWNAVGFAENPFLTVIQASGEIIAEFATRAAISAGQQRKITWGAVKGDSYENSAVNITMVSIYPVELQQGDLIAINLAQSATTTEAQPVFFILAPILA